MHAYMNWVEWWHTCTTEHKWKSEDKFWEWCSPFIFGSRGHQPCSAELVFQCSFVYSCVLHVHCVCVSVCISIVQCLIIQIIEIWSLWVICFGQFVNFKEYFYISLGRHIHWFPWVMLELKYFSRSCQIIF